MSDDSSLLDAVRRAQAGDQEAWQALLARFRPMLERQADGFLQGQNSELSNSDLVQEAWIRVWRGLGEFKGAALDDFGAATFCSWVRTTSRRAMVNVCQARNAQRRQPPGHQMRLGDGTDSSVANTAYHVPAAGDKSPSENVVEQEDAARICTAMEHDLDALGRTIIELAFFEELSLRQIAEILDLGYDKVRARFHQALGTLEDRLGN